MSVDDNVARELRREKSVSVSEVALQVDGGIQLRSANISKKFVQAAPRLSPSSAKKKIIIINNSVGVSKNWSSVFTCTV